MKKIVVTNKETNEQVIRFDYHLDGLSPEVATLYALSAARFTIEKDASEIMSFIISFRQDALDGTLLKTEEEEIAELKKLFNIIVEDVEAKINEATSATDLFK